jgi:hypothetical protein
MKKTASRKLGVLLIAQSIIWEGALIGSAIVLRGSGRTHWFVLPILVISFISSIGIIAYYQNK